MRVHVTELQPGDQLSQNIFTDYGLHVMSQGTILKERDLSRLYQLHIDYVEIDYRTSSPESAPARYDDELQPLYEDAYAGIELMFKRAVEEGNVLESDVNESFQPLVENIKAERDILSLLLKLNDQDDYTYLHSVQVGMLSHFLARWLGFGEADIARAGKAGFLHDIGKCRIPEEILNKPGRLTEEEFREVRNHAQYGYDLLIGSFEDDTYALAALQHHERMNGTGYPNRLVGEQIHPVAKIVAIADVYSAMITSRSYQAKRDMLTVLKELYQLSFGELDPHMTQTFIRHMLPNFIGKKVKVASGEIGTVIMNHPTDLFHPLIQVDGRFIDTSVHPSYEIVQVFM